jgi:hypothetical protein
MCCRLLTSLYGGFGCSLFIIACLHVSTGFEAITRSQTHRLSRRGPRFSSEHFRQVLSSLKLIAGVRQIDETGEF